MLVAVEEHLMQVVLEDPEVRVAAETADLALVPDNLEQQILEAAEAAEAALNLNLQLVVVLVVLEELQ